MWVGQLRDSDYETRQKAAGSLAALGEAAREVLEQATQSDDAETRAAAEVLLKKLESASVSLFVFDREGRPAAGAEAEVRAYAQRGNSEWNERAAKSITVSAAGAACLAGLLPGEGGLSFNWQHRYTTQECTPCWSLHFHRGDNPIFVTLAGGGSVEIRVQDSDGAPLKDARAQLYQGARFTPELLDLQLALYEQWPQNTLAGLTGVDGAAKVEGAEGSYQCVVQAYGYLPCLAGTARLAEGQTVKLPLVKLEKKNAGQLHLALLKSNGEPLKKTRVSVLLEYQFAGPEAQASKKALQREARRLRAQLSMRGRMDQSETDEDGKITIDDLRPGNYTLMAAAGYTEEAPWRAPELAIERGQTTELGSLKPCPVGAIEGFVRGPDGKGLRYSSVKAVPEEDMADGSATADNGFNWGFRARALPGLRNSQSQENGRYVLKNLVPGRYAVCINNAGLGQQVMIFGLEVSAEKTTQAPEAIVPATTRPVTQEIKGTVLLPDGKPAQGARVNLYYGQGYSSGSACDEKGSFRFHENGASGGHLIVKATGCRPLCLDVSTTSLKLDDLALRLEKQDYGSLRVKAVDESGKPLSGVAIMLSGPRRLRGYYRGISQERQFVTNGNGEVKISGLAVGERGLQFWCDGYCPPEDFRAVIAPDMEAFATVVLRKGLALSGRIVAPESYEQDSRGTTGVLPVPERTAFSRTIVCLLGNTNRTSRVTPEGRFTFAGLVPGKYSVTAYAPGLILAEHPQVVLSLDDSTKEPCLKLVPPCGVAIAVDKRLEGWSAVLVPKGSWDPLSVPSRSRDMRPHSSSCVDSAGRAEFWGSGPGEYDILLARGQDRFPNALSSSASRGTATVPVQLVCGPVEARPLKNVAELRALPAVVLKVPTLRDSARVSGHLVCPKASAEGGDNLANVSISLVGRAAVGCVHFGYPGTLTRAAQQKPLILGTPPPGMPLGAALPGAFVFEAVPPGEYKVVAEVNRYSQPYERTGKEAVRQPPVLLAAIVVPADARLDLGKLRYDLPLLAARAEDAVDDYREWRWRQEAEAEDQIPFFQP